MSVHKLEPLKDGKQRWEVRVHVGNNEYRTKTIRGSERDALRYERSIRVKADNGETIAKKIKETFKEAGEAFIKRAEQNGKSASYIASRKGLLNNHVYGRIGHMRINHVTDTVRREQVLGPLRDEGKGQDLIDRVSVAISSVILAAMRRAVIHFNPLEQNTRASQEDKVKAKDDAEQKNKTGRAFTDNEVRRTLGAAKSSTAKMLLELLFQTGMRHGEAAGLPSKAVDVDACTIRIEQRLASRDKAKDGKRGRIKSGTKTGDKGKRTVPVDPEFMARLAIYIKGHPGTLVFQSRTGRPINLNNFAKRAWAGALERAEIEHEPMYSTRHTFVSQLVANGVPEIVIKELIGHTGKSRIIERYMHAYADQKKSAVLAHAARIRGDAPAPEPTPPAPAPEAVAPTHSERRRFDVIDGGKSANHSEPIRNGGRVQREVGTRSTVSG